MKVKTQGFWSWLTFICLLPSYVLHNYFYLFAVSKISISMWLWLWQNIYVRSCQDNLPKISSNFCATTIGGWWWHAKTFWSPWCCKNTCRSLFIIFESCYEVSGSSLFSWLNKFFMVLCTERKHIILYIIYRRYILVSNIPYHIIGPYILFTLSKLYCCWSLVKFNRRNLFGGFAIGRMFYQNVATSCLV